MNRLKNIFGILFFLVVGCSQSIKFDGIVRKNGLFVDAQTGQPLDGNYQSETPIGATYTGSHESTFEFKNGIPIGEWTYYFNGDPIHSGKFLEERDVKSKINSMTSSKRTDLNYWEEGDIWTMDVELYFPEKIDSNLLINIVEITQLELGQRYPTKTIRVYNVNDTTRVKIY